MSRDLLRRIQRLEVVRAPQGRFVGIGLSSRTEADAAAEYAEKCCEFGITESDNVQVILLSFDDEPAPDWGFLRHHRKISLQF
jgi:hypothetical protein